MLFSSSKKESEYRLLPDSHLSDTLPDRSLTPNRSKEEFDRDAPRKIERLVPRVSPRIISDATIGLSDGLTVPFALTAGLSALGDTRLVIYAGLAELIAGAISMGLGGYLGAVSENQAYEATLHGTRKLMAEDPSATRELVTSTFEGYGFSQDLLDSLVAQLVTSESNTEDFLMRFQHQLPESSNSTSRAYVSSCTIAIGYFLGGLIPLGPYFIFEANHFALLWSIAVMAVALFVFGYVKTLLVGQGRKVACLKGDVQMVVLGGLAAAAAMGCVKAIGSS